MASASTLFFFALGAGIPTAVLVAFEYYAWSNNRKVQNWPSTRGRIVRSWVERKHFDDSTYYKPNVEYTYSVNGTEYSCTRIGYGYLSQPGTESAAQRILEPWPVGQEVTVWYDPARPGVAVLTKELPKWFFTFLIVWLIVEAALCVVVWKWGN